jgi:hypothetical protein
MTLDEIAFNIHNIAYGGLPSDDDRIGIRQIKEWVKYWRAKLIFEYTQKGKNINPQLVQDLGCLALSTVDKADCVSASWGCTIKKVIIPRLVDLPNNGGLIWVGLIDKQTPLAITTSGNVHFMRSSRTTGKMERAYMIGTSLYVNTPDSYNLKWINVRGVFDDPNDVTTCDTNGNCTCLRDDIDNYPVSASMVQMITQGIMANELNMELKTKNDEVNDARGN